MEGNNEMSSSQGGNAPRRGGARQGSLRLFGNDISTTSSSNPADTNTAIRGYTPETLPVPNQTGYGSMTTSLNEKILYHHIGEMLEDPSGNSFTPDALKLQTMERVLPKYDFKIVCPSSSTIMSVGQNWNRGRGREHVIGHPNNEARFRVWIDRKWPPSSNLTPTQQWARWNAEWTLNRSLQAMRYLHSNPEAAIYHEPSRSIYLNPEADLNRVNQVVYRFHQGQLPKLTFKDRLHFKTSKAKKAQHREVEGGNGRGIHEETSSEEED